MQFFFFLTWTLVHFILGQVDHARGLVLVLVIKLMDRFSRKNILVSLTKIGFGVFYLARIVFCDSHAWFYPR